MRICGVDTETTWTKPVDAKKARILEIGAAIFDDQDWSRHLFYKKFVWDPSYSPLGPEIEELIGVKEEEIAKDGIPLSTALRELECFAKGCDYFMAHNKAFDETVINCERKRVGMDPNKIPFICTVNDVPHVNKRCRQLSHLALDYGVAIDPSKLHRALDDVLLMGDMMKRGGFKVQAIVDYMSIPWLYLEAVIPKPWTDGGKGKDLAREKGFKWEQTYHSDPKFEKKWVKKIKELELEKEKADLPFPVIILEVPA
jgi:hypothetical protein